MSMANRFFIIICSVICCLIGSAAVQADPMSDALAKAAYDCEIKTLEAMIRAGVDLNRPGKPRRKYSSLAPCYYAAEKDCLKAVELLAQAGADLDARTPDGQTALWIAANRGHLKVVKVLLDYGANPALADKHGATPMSEAAARNHPQIITLIASAAPPPDRAAGWDRIVLSEGGFVQGRVLTPKFTVASGLGRVTVETKRIAKLFFGGGPDKRPLIVLRTGDRLTGPIEPGAVKVKLCTGQEKDVAADQIKVIHLWAKN